MRRIYKTSEREHSISWLLTHSKDLEDKAKRQKDVSKLLYACLELRTALEMLEFLLVLGSIADTERNQLAEEMQSKNGVESANKKLKSISLRTQEFYACVCEVTGVNGKIFNYSQSSDIKWQLSQYVHTYTKTQPEMTYNGTFVQSAFQVLATARQFIINSLIEENDQYVIQNIEFKTMTDKDKGLLKDYKEGKIDRDSLKTKLQEGYIKPGNVTSNYFR